MDHLGSRNLENEIYRKKDQHKDSSIGKLLLNLLGHGVYAVGIPLPHI